MADIYVVRVFPDSPEGGNPAPTVLDAEALDSEAMRGIAARYGHESGFVLPASPGSTADFRFRFFVPRHEMEMCGHATIGALWLLRRQGRIGAGTFCIETLSGIVYGIVPDDGPISISQPAGVVEALTEADAEAVCDVLGIGAEDLAEPLLLNARTSRVKTLVALKDPGRLHGLAPDFSRMDAVCGGIGSTGLYPFAKSSRAQAELAYTILEAARQSTTLGIRKPEQQEESVRGARATPACPAASFERGASFKTMH